MSHFNSIFKTENGDTVVFPLGIALKFGRELDGDDAITRAKSLVSRGNLLAIPFGILMYIIGTRFLEEVGGFLGLIVLSTSIVVVYGIAMVTLLGAKTKYVASIHGEIVRE